MSMQEPPGEEDGAANLAQRFQSERVRSQQGAGGFAKRWGRTARIRFHRRSRQRLWLEHVSSRVGSTLNCLLVVGGIIVFCIVR
jgi:hypothetical protein